MNWDNVKIMAKDQRVQGYVIGWSVCFGSILLVNKYFSPEVYLNLPEVAKQALINGEPIGLTSKLGNLILIKESALNILETTATVAQV